MKQFHDSMKDVLEASDSKALAPEVVIILKSGRIPLNHMKDTFPSNREAMRRPELMLVKYAYMITLSSIQRWRSLSRHPCRWIQFR